MDAARRLRPIVYLVVAADAIQLAGTHFAALRQPDAHPLDWLGAVLLLAGPFLVKDTEPEELLRAVRVVNDGDALLSPSVTRRLMAAMARVSRRVAQPPELGRITEREREVLALVGERLNNAEIAARLFITPLTAKTHVSRIMATLGARGRVQLVVTAYESGLVRPGWDPAPPDAPQQCRPAAVTPRSSAAVSPGRCLPGEQGGGPKSLPAADAVGR